MSLSCFQPNRNLKFKNPKKVYGEDDDYTTVLADICNEFETSKSVRFNVWGFGQSRWPVDCSYDLFTVVTQITNIIKQFQCGNFFDFTLDFYEQGIERKLTFKQQNENVFITCFSGTNWKPSPSQITMEKRAVKELFLNFYDSFYFYANELCGDLIEHHLLNEWRL